MTIYSAVPKLYQNADRLAFLIALIMTIVRTIFDRKAIHRIGCQYQPSTG